jgi:hypothetical protein
MLNDLDTVIRVYSTTNDGSIYKLTFLWLIELTYMYLWHAYLTVNRRVCACDHMFLLKRILRASRVCFSHTLQCRSAQCGTRWVPVHADSVRVLKFFESCLNPLLKNNVNIISAIEGTWSSVYFRNFRWNNETVLHFRWRYGYEH